MAEPIDDLFVRLGLETDDKEFKDASRNFDQLKSQVLQFGAAIGAGFGLKEMTFGFAQATDELARFAEVFDIDPEFVDRLAFAFQQTGGSADDAFQSIRNIADIIEQTQWGEISEAAFREFGVDPMLLDGVEGIAQSYERIVAAAQGMNPETARRFFSAMGLSEADLRLSRGTGDQSFSSLMQEAGELANMNREMMDQAREFQVSIGRASRAIEGVSRELSAMFVGDLADSISKLADFLADNRDQFADFVREALPAIKGAAAGLSIIAGLQAGRAALGALQNIPGATFAAAGLGALYMSRQTEQEQDRERVIREEEERQRVEESGNYYRTPFDPEDIPTVRDIPGQEKTSSIENNYRIEVNGAGNPEQVANAVMSRIRDYARDAQEFTEVAAS